MEKDYEKYKKDSEEYVGLDDKNKDTGSDDSDDTGRSPEDDGDDTGSDDGEEDRTKEPSTESPEDMQTPIEQGGDTMDADIAAFDAQASAEDAAIEGATPFDSDFDTIAPDLEDKGNVKVLRVSYAENVKSGKKTNQGTAFVVIPSVDANGDVKDETKSITFYLDADRRPIINNEYMPLMIYNAIVKAIADDPDTQAIEVAGAPAADSPEGSVDLPATPEEGGVISATSVTAEMEVEKNIDINLTPAEDLPATTTDTTELPTPTPDEAAANEPMTGLEPDPEAPAATEPVSVENPVDSSISTTPTLPTGDEDFNDTDDEDSLANLDDTEANSVELDSEELDVEADDSIDETSEFDKRLIDLMDVSPKMVFSVATSMIPFLQNDDANRALMGSNMQRQAVPLLTTEAPVIGTGIENKAAIDSGVCVIAEEDGVVLSAESNKIVIKADDGHVHEYKLTKFARSNQSNCYNQRPIVFKGDTVKKGDVIADGPSTSNGEIALGKNPLIGFMTWEGYNYEDAVLLSERLVRNDVYTSVHIEEYETEARDTKLGPEEITRDIPSASTDSIKDLDENGIIRIGAEVRAGDILVGKVTPKGETELTAEERLLRAIFGEKAREVRDTSLKVPHGEYGIVVNVKVFTRENGDELSPGVNKSVRIYIAQKRKISVGDKMAGRHGNKGVVSRVLPVEDMPFLPNGRPLDIVLNPLGVPSRMNIGQVLEIHLSLAAKVLGFNISTPVFDGADENDIMDALDLANDYANLEWDEFAAKYKDALNPEVFDYLDKNKAHREEWKGVHIGRDGKVRLRDGRTGEYFDSPVTIGFMHYLKLHHLVDDKIHARSTGPYSLVTQQPLGGKAQFGGQRFGEMEVWALEAYGASYTLQEILTVKSDDVVGRVKTYEAIIKGENIPEPGIPESFKVLLKELQSLALDVRVLDRDNNEVRLLESSEYEVTDFKKVLDDGYHRDSKKDEAEFARSGFQGQKVGEEGMEDDSIDDFGYDDEQDDVDDYGDGNSDIME